MSYKQSIVLCDESEVGEYLLLSASGGSLPYSEYDTGNELNDHVLLGVVINNDSDEDDITKDSGKRWRTIRANEKISQAVLNFMGLQNVTEIVDVFELLFCRELRDMIVKETNRYN